MPFNIIRADITKVKADAIVNTANPQVAVGAGVDQAIYVAAGAKALLAERAKIGPMKPGQAAATPAFALDAKYIIHTVGPAWRGGGYGEREAVASCYRESLELADKLGCESVAFPLISTGTYGFPKDEALRIAISEISAFLFWHEMDVTMVVYSKEAFVISSKAFANIQTFIDDKDVKESSGRTIARRERRRILDSFREWRREKEIQKLEEEFGKFPPEGVEAGGMPFDEERWLDEEEELPDAPYSMSDAGRPDASYSIPDASLPEELLRNAGAGAPSQQMPSQQMPSQQMPSQQMPSQQMPLKEQMPLEKAKGRTGFAPSFGVRKDKRDKTIKEVLGNKGESFQHMLFRIIDRKGLTDPEVYKKANLDRKLFSKIRNSEDYLPKKKTVLALAVALELSMDETIDLLQRAGIALSPSNDFDLIVGYCIDHRIYDIMDINTYLFAFDQPLLGA